MTKTLLLLALVVTAPPLQTGSDPVGDAIAGIEDTIGGALDALNEAGAVIGNGLNGLVGSKTTTPVMGSDDYSEEKIYLSNTAGRLESTANSTEWVVKDNITEHTRFNVVVVKQNTIVTNYSVVINYTNETVTINQGHVENPDTTVYPKYKDIQYIDHHWEDVVNGRANASTGVKIWAIIDNTGCDPKAPCKEIRNEYTNLWDRLIGSVVP